MKRRNAETGKLRRPMKRIKITDGMYGNSMLYLKFVMLWATVVIADHMLEFRFEFLWPLWMMVRSVYDTFKYQGLIFSVFFVCIALTSDMLCFFFIPLQYIFFAASTYVWVQYVWYTFAEKGVCVPTVALCCVVVYAEGALRGGAARGGLDLCRPLAAHSVGYPIVTLGVTVNSYVRYTLRLHRQRMVVVQELYQMLKSPPEQAVSPEPKPEPATSEASTETVDERDVTVPTRRKKLVNGECLDIHEKFEYLTKHLESQLAKKAQAQAQARADDLEDNTEPCKMTASPNQQVFRAAKSERRDTRDERRRHRNKDKDRDDCHSHRTNEHSKEQIVKDKDIESTKEIIKNHKDNSTQSKDSSATRDKEEIKREKEEIRREKEEIKREKEMREKDREREREREREQRIARALCEELRTTREELQAARAAEAEAKHALAELHKKHSSWRCSEKAALERKLCEERRARTHAETLLRSQASKNSSTECENEYCKSRIRASHSEASSLRRELQRTRDKAARLHHDLANATQQIRTLESRPPEPAPAPALQERAAHLERALSAETRVKLDLLSALGDAKRQLRTHDCLISRQEKEIEELKAQMLAVMPSEYMTHIASGVSKFRLSDASPLDPNASVYTPRQLCSDA